MQWTDWMTLAIIVGVGVIEILRGVRAGGMGLALFDAAGIAVAAVAATNLSGPLAGLVHLQRSLVTLGVFVVLVVGALILGHWLFSITGWSFQTLDGLLSFLFGMVSGWAIAHMVLRILLESQGHTGPVGSLMASAPVAREVLEFRTWNRLVNLLFKARLGERTPWNVSRARF